MIEISLNNMPDNKIAADALEWYMSEEYPSCSQILSKTKHGLLFGYIVPWEQNDGISVFVHMNQDDLMTNGVYAFLEENGYINREQILDAIALNPFTDVLSYTNDIGILGTKGMDIDQIVEKLKELDIRQSLFYQ